MDKGINSSAPEVEVKVISDEEYHRGGQAAH